MYGLKLVSFQSESHQSPLFDAVLALGSLPDSQLTALGVTSPLPDASHLANFPIEPDQSICILDFQAVNYLDSQGCDLGGMQSGSILRSAQAAYGYVRAISQACLRCQSLTLIRLLPAPHPCTADLNIFHALCTGALRSLQSEHLNLVVSSVTLLDPPDGRTLENVLNTIFASSNIPSDLYLDAQGELLARSTQSIRVGIERLEPLLLVGQWKTVYVFGGASALSLECLRHVLNHNSEVHLFGRRTYDRIYDAIPALRSCTDLKAYILEHEPKHRSNLQSLRKRIAYLASQIELSRAIELLQSLCRAVQYHACDITDADTLGTNLSHLDAAGVRPTSIIFAAGLLRDGLIVNKSEQDFLDVVSVKCIGLLNVLNRCPLGDCQSLYVFGSVSGTYGNKGQTNYSAANEALYRLAKLFSVTHPDLKTFVFSWGPWAEVGMAQPEVNAQFARRGISTLKNQQGVSCFIYAANLNASGFHAPVCGFAPWNDLESTFNTGLSPDLGSIYQLRSRLPQAGSAIRHFQCSSSTAGRAKAFEVNLPDTPLFRDHVLGDQFVLPFAFFVEIFLDACVDLTPARPPVIQDLRCLRGVKVPLGTQTIAISLSYGDADSDGSRIASIYVGDSNFPSYTARLRTDRALLSAPAAATEGSSPLVETLASPAECYRDDLFHGSVYQVIECLQSATTTSIRASVMLSGVANDVGVITGQFWICPPPLYDSVAQLALIWRRIFDGQTALPSSVSCLAVLEATKLTGRLDVRLLNIQTTEFDMTFDVCIYGIDDELLLYARDMICSCSSTLRRLNKQWLASVKQPLLSEGSAMLL